MQTTSSKESLTKRIDNEHQQLRSIRKNIEEQIQLRFQKAESNLCAEISDPNANLPKKYLNPNSIRRKRERSRRGSRKKKKRRKSRKKDISVQGIKDSIIVDSNRKMNTGIEGGEARIGSGKDSERLRKLKRSKSGMRKFEKTGKAKAGLRFDNKSRGFRPSRMAKKVKRRLKENNIKRIKSANVIPNIVKEMQDLHLTGKISKQPRQFTSSRSIERFPIINQELAQKKEVVKAKGVSFSMQKKIIMIDKNQPLFPRRNLSMLNIKPILKIGGTKFGHDKSIEVESESKKGDETSFGVNLGNQLREKFIKKKGGRTRRPSSVAHVQGGNSQGFSSPQPRMLRKSRNSINLAHATPRGNRPRRDQMAMNSQLRGQAGHQGQQQQQHLYVNQGREGSHQIQHQQQPNQRQTGSFIGNQMQAQHGYARPNKSNRNKLAKHLNPQLQTYQGGQQRLKSDRNQFHSMNNQNQSQQQQQQMRARRKSLTIQQQNMHNINHGQAPQNIILNNINSRANLPQNINIPQQLIIQNQNGGQNDPNLKISFIGQNQGNSPNGFNQQQLRGNNIVLVQNPRNNQQQHSMFSPRRAQNNMIQVQQQGNIQNGNIQLIPQNNQNQVIMGNNIIVVNPGSNMVIQGGMGN